ncbi:MAG: hypothetical protein WBP45_11150, partial [Daejeonella sp.]
YTVSEGETRIVTDLKDISFRNAEAKEYLDQLLLVDESTSEELVIHKSKGNEFLPSPMLPDLIINKKSAQLSEIILQNILDIQTDPDKNIAKAEAVNNQVKSFLDICKTEVEAMKVAAYVSKVNAQ